MGAIFFIFLIIITTFGGVAYSAPSDLTEMRFMNSSYFRSSQPYFGGEDKASNLSSVGVVVQTQSVKSKSSHAIDFEAIYSLPENAAYINLKELYFDFDSNQRDIVFGRKLYTWSMADAAWQSALWQPLFRWDGMRPEENGLFAGFWRDRLNKKTEAILFLSPIYAPTLGPNYDEKDSRLYSANPWFRPPPPRANIIGADTDVFSRVSRPETKDIIMNPGIGGKLNIEASPNQTIGVAYAYKPIPQLFVSYDYKVKAAQENGGVELTFYPWIAYHHLATVDFTEKNRRSSYNVSLTYENPVRTMERDDRVFPSLPESLQASFIMHRDIHGEGPSAFKIYGGVMRHWGGIAPDGGPATSDTSQFEIRHRYIGAVKAGLKYPIWNKVRRLTNAVEVNYDWLVHGGTLLTELEFALGEGWVWHLSYDMIGVFTTPPQKYENSFINTYRANDRLAARLSYVY